ncbi:MAG: FecCD family ABC transporter permease, partial [Gammaproteobacteria bacterium]
LAAFAAGGLLALNGVWMQALLRNPLADPYVLGVSGGAAVGGLGAIVIGAAGVAVAMSAALGAVVATALVFSLAHGRGAWTAERLLLTGVVVAAGASALVSLLLALAEERQLRGMLFWLMGDLSLATSPWPLVIALGLALPLAIAVGRPLNVLARGELQARALGLAVQPLRLGLFLATSVLTGLVVITVGSIGFVGLLVPHAMRRLLGTDHRLVAPASALAGGSLLVLADLAARTVVAPRQLPVGALTALIGVPWVLLVIARARRPGG